MILRGLTELISEQCEFSSEGVGNVENAETTDGDCVGAPFRRTE